ncbi:MAG: EVE domain-containing protein [Bacteroidales bacterium]|nr:EVE domain-containing protein [Bacteroidales bacterium]MBN2862184.1 EVE domain-containing protein [Bacteroidales bacterium]
MLEKDIENLIANFPDEFFPESGFKLIGQQVRLGKCYADIIFEDKHKRKIIVEVKRGLLSRVASGQIVEYYGLLKVENPNEIIELVLCANIIPPERKLFLETVGIECKELGINLIFQVARKVGYEFIKTSKKDIQIEDGELPISDNIWLFQANPHRYDIINALADQEVGIDIHWEVNQYRNEIAKDDIGIIWLSGREAGIYAITRLLTDPGLMAESEAEKKYWVDIADKEGERLRVKMRIVKNLLYKPLTKGTIRNIEGLRNLSILKQPRGTNFRVTVDEWNIIRGLIQ